VSARRDAIIERLFNAWWQRHTRKKRDGIPSPHDCFVAGYKTARDIWQADPPPPVPTEWRGKENDN